MMVLRECVRRYHRLPQTVVVDGGPEFASVYFETLLARYECTKKTRPMAQPRFGSVCERLFGTTNTQFVHTLAGNTQLRRNVRQVTKSVDPKEHACWTLDHLAVRLDEWAEEIYETIEHPALGTSPRDAFATGMAQSGHRPHRVIPFDDDFRMLTLPTTRKGTATVHPRRGVTINAIAYWCETFVDATIEQTAVPVRFDPFDAGVAYAFVKDRWVRCISEYHAQFAGRSEREIRLATSELRRRQQQHARQAPVTAQKLAAFLASVEAEELLLEQRLRDAAAKDIARRGAWEPLAVHAPLASRPAEPSAPGGDAIREEDSLVIYGDY